MSTSESRSLTSSDRGDTRSLRLKDLLNPVDDTISHTETSQQTERTSRGVTTSVTTGSVTSELSVDVSVSTHVRTYPGPASPTMTSQSPSSCSQQWRFVKMTGRPVSRSYVLATPVARMPSSCAKGQRAREYPAQDCNRPGGLNPTLPQPISQRDHYVTPARMEAIASEFTNQPQFHFPNMLPSSGPSSTMPQIGVETTKAQYSVLKRKIEQDFQIPVDVQAGSKVADEKRKRCAESCTRARKKRKDKEQDSAGRIAALKTQICEVTEETRYYRKERDDFKDVVLRHHGYIEPRPLSLNPRCHVTRNDASPAHY